MTASAAYTFVPLAHSHLPIIAGWTAQPHVARWYNSPGEALASIREHVDETGIDCFLVELDGRPFGYIQVYDPFAFADHPYRDQPAGTRGIDQFIGVAELIGRGHGPRFVRQFARGLFEQGAPRVVTDPSPANASAIRAYGKAGFHPIGPRRTDWGPVLLMACDPEH
jgi:aminoglycoside 6'-N-acetyltransferase